MKTKKIFEDRLSLYGQKFDGTDKKTVKRRWFIRLATIGLIAYGIIVALFHIFYLPRFHGKELFVLFWTGLSYALTSLGIIIEKTDKLPKSFLTKRDIREFVERQFVSYQTGPAYLDVITRNFQQGDRVMHEHFIYPADTPKNEAEFIRSLRGYKGPKWNTEGYVMAINDPIPAENDVFKAGEGKLYMNMIEAHLFPELTNWKCLLPVAKNEGDLMATLDRLCEAIVLDIVRKKMEEALSEDCPLFETDILLTKEDIIPYFDTSSECETGEEILRLFEEANAVIEDSLRIACPTV